MATQEITTQQQIYMEFIEFTNDIEPMEKDGLNPHFKSKYVTLDEIYKKIKPSCIKHKVRVIHKVESSVLDTGGLYVEVTPMFVCRYGIFEGGTFRCISTNQIQNNGSVITYAKRYTISAFLGIASDEDDDGNAAVEGVTVVNAIPSGIQQIKTVANKTIVKKETKPLTLADKIRSMTKENAKEINEEVKKSSDEKIINAFMKMLDHLGLELVHGEVEEKLVMPPCPF